MTDRSEWLREYRRKNRDRLRAYHAWYRAKYKEKMRVLDARASAKRREKMKGETEREKQRAKDRAYYRANRERILETKRKWRESRGRDNEQATPVAGEIVAANHLERTI